MRTIKKIFACIALSAAALFSSEMIAQPTWTVGPKLGINHGSFTGVTNPEYRMDISAGVFAMYSKWEHFGISGDLVYTGRRAKYMLNVPEVGWTDRRTLLQYVELPVMANVFFLPRGSKIRPKVMLGPTFSYMVADREWGAGPSSNFNNFDIGISGGAGANFRLTEMTWLNVDVKYTRNFFDVGARTSEAESVMTHGLGVMFGLGFGL